MTVRTYFDKSNTLIYNSLINTGRNPVAELYRGGTTDAPQYSRFIFHFDETRLKSLYTGSTFPVLSSMTHTLKITNTGSFDKALLNGETSSGKDRASSFDLIVFRVNQPWDEGCGYDFETINITNNTLTSTSPSNWVEARTLSNWSGGTGVYSGSPSGITIATQSFDQGNENLEIDITSYVNGLLTGDTNYGLGIAYTRTLELTPSTELQYVGFFTRHSQTFYVPYIETTYNTHIQDDRSSFYLDKNNKLYLYVNVAGNPTNLDSLPTVKIYDNDDVLFSSYTSTAVTLVTKGVYSIDIKVPTTSSYNDCTMFTDVWSGISINNVTRPAIELEFSLKDSLGYYDIGDNSGLPLKAGFTISGLNNREKLQVGDVRKVTVNSRIPYTVNQSQNLSNLKYRIYILEGTSQIDVISWEQIEQTASSNYFLIDTLSLLSGNIYYIDLKFESNQEITTHTNIISFEIVNISQTRESQ